jgi:uncharacterized membrane protein
METLYFIAGSVFGAALISLPYAFLVILSGKLLMRKRLYYLDAYKTSIVYFAVSSILGFLLASVPFSIEVVFVVNFILIGFCFGYFLKDAKTGLRVNFAPGLVVWFGTVMMLSPLIILSIFFFVDL